MKWTKEKYLDVINNSLLFDIEDKTSDDYHTEYRYLQEKVCEYYYTYQSWIKPYSLELVEKFSESVKYYSKDKGLFIAYLATIVKKAVNKAKGIEAVDNVRCGVKIEKSVQKNIRLIVNIAKNKNWKLDDNDIVEKLSMAIGKSQEKIKKLLEINAYAIILSENMRIGDEEVSLFDSVPDNTTPEQIVISKENAVSVLDRIEKVTGVLSQSKLKIVSAIITIMLVGFDFERVFLIEELESYSFFNREFYDKQNAKEDKIKDSEIAKILGVSKVYISKVRNSLRSIVWV